MDLPQRFDKLTKHQKEYKLKPFTEYYYSSSGRGFKFLRMPYWMNTYGYWMRQEQRRKLPHYYRTFERGTVVMVDFGVQIASEFCGPHFAVVLNRNDDKYNPVITVIPLSSKEKAWYANLGDELLQRISERFYSIQEQVDVSLNDAEQRMKPLQARFAGGYIHSFNDSDAKILVAAGVAHNHDHLDFTITVGSSNLDVKRYVAAIKTADGYETSKGLMTYVDEIENTLAEVKVLQAKLDYVNSMLPAMQSLIKKSTQYNKPTFANTRNVTTVSKLRVVKFNNGNVSENIHISSEAMQQIELKLSRYI